jgi:hypothetical protein
MNGRLYAPGRFTPGERALGTNWIGGRVDPRAGLNDVEKKKFLTLPGLELRLLGHPARSQSLYRLRYPGSENRVLKRIFRPMREEVQEDNGENSVNTEHRNLYSP